MQEVNLNNKEKAVCFCKDWFAVQSSQTVFKYISRDIFYQSLLNLIESNGQELYQSQNTCGVTAVLYLSASHDIFNFTKFVISLYEKGVGELNEYTIKPEDQLLKWAETVQPKGLFNGVSLVVVGSIRFVENTSLKFKLGTMDGMTWPNEIKSLSKTVLNGVLVPQYSFLFGWNLSKMKQSLSDDKTIILLYRTSSWREHGNPFKDAWHYIVIKKINRNEEGGIEITYWDYGSEKTKKLKLSNFYKGVIKTFVFYNN